MIVEMREDAFDVVDLQRAANALRLGAGAHHEVLEEKLAAATEQLRQGHLAFRPVKNIGLLDLDPGQRPLFVRQPVAPPCQLFLLGEQRSPRLDPLRLGHDLM